MTSDEIYKNYLVAYKERVELENKIEELIEKWKNGETIISSEMIQDVVDKGYQRLDELRKTEEKLHTEYQLQNQKEETKRFDDMRIRQNLGTSPTGYETTSGVLSSDASKSHLIAVKKSPEQLEQEKTVLLSSIKAKVQSGEITLSQASKLVSDVNSSYSFYVQDNKEKEQHSMRR